MTDSEEAERTWSRESFCILEGSGPDSLFIELKINKLIAKFLSVRQVYK